MTDEQRRVRSDSDEILEAMERMRELERAKRTEPISSPAFHRLADEVEASAREVWELAQRQNRDGDAAETTGATIDETEPLDETG